MALAAIPGAEYPVLPPQPQEVVLEATAKVPAFFNNDGITEENVWQILDDIIFCESSGKRGIQILDVNNKMSRGELMFQDATWAWMSKAAGIKGSPLERGKAIQVARYALLNGHGKHWTCFKEAMAELR